MLMADESSFAKTEHQAKSVRSDSTLISGDDPIPPWGSYNPVDASTVSPLSEEKP